MEHELAYDLESLKAGIERSNNNIKIFEDAIQGEYKTIRDYSRMIATLEEKASNDNPNGRNS